MTRSTHSLRGDSPPATGTDRGLSQIVSVILLIAVAVVLIGGVAGFMFGIFGNLGSGAPQAQFSFQWDNDGAGNLTVSMMGGPAISESNAQELRIVNQDDGSTYLWGDASASNFDQEATDDEITAGDAATASGIQDTATLITDGSGTEDQSFDPGETVAVVWVGENAQQTQTLATFTVPS